jgi:hypothetical protein
MGIAAVASARLGNTGCFNAAFYPAERMAHPVPARRCSPAWPKASEIRLATFSDRAQLLGMVLDEERQAVRPALRRLAVLPF